MKQSEKIEKALNNGQLVTTEEECPNGFNSWKKAHYQITRLLGVKFDEGGRNIIWDTFNDCGDDGLCQLAEQWTQEFELKYQGIDWREDGTPDYWLTIDEFVEGKLK